jgi:hypothetical protein
MRKLLFTAALIAVASQASATSWMIGDNDGYGMGICDGCDHPFNGSTANYDGRSAAEKAASDGAQFTDTYSTAHSGYGPQSGKVATFTFSGLGNTWTAGHLEIDMADFQASTYGQVITTFNGIVQDFGYNDGFPHTVIHEYTLDAAVLASINTSHQLVINIDRNNSGDFYGFDYLKLNDFPITAAVPEPETYAMMLAGLGLMGAVARRRSKKQG